MHTTQTVTNHIRLPGAAMVPLRPFILSEWTPATALVTTASILPEQWLAPQSNLGPEAALMRAVLEDAIACFQKGSLSKGRRVQRLAREAEAWFFSDDAHWLFSFVAICRALKLAPDYVRRGLRQWRERQPSVAQTPVSPIVHEQSYFSRSAARVQQRGCA